MKRRIILSIAFLLSVVTVSLTSSDPAVQAQNQLRPVADTGVITLGPGQVLRLSVLSGTPTANGTFSFRQIGYSPGTCAGGVCKLSAQSQTTTNPLTLMPGEAASIVVDPENQSGEIYLRALVLSNRREAEVKAFIIDRTTQQIYAVIDLSGYFAP